MPQLGTFVTFIDEEAVADAHFVREALEVGAVRIAADRATGDDARARCTTTSRAQERAVAATTPTRSRGSTTTCTACSATCPAARSRGG